MLTQEQRDQFRLTLSAWNNYSAENINDLDIDDMIDDDQIVETSETIDDFFKVRGSTKRSQTISGDLYVWYNEQVRKGARRGNLYVMDFGDARACYFDGES